MNVIILIGNLVRDPELRNLQNGNAACNFTIAIDRNKKPDGTCETDFIPIVTFGNRATTCAKYLAKGRKVAVEGRLQISQYTAQDGSKRTKAEVLANNVTFLTSASGEGGGQQSGNSSYSDVRPSYAPPAPVVSEPMARPTQERIDPNMIIQNPYTGTGDDDLPF